MKRPVAGIVGWGKTLGCIASSITVNLPEPGHIHRGAGKHTGAAHTVFRAWQKCTAASRHGRRDVCRLVAYTDSAKVTSNLVGSSAGPSSSPNVMGNGLSACTGLTGGEMLQSEPDPPVSPRGLWQRGDPRRPGHTAISSKRPCIFHPRRSRRPARGDETAMKSCDEQRFADSNRTASGQRPSMGQDMQKGRRTEIEFINGLVVREGEKLGIACGANAALTDMSSAVERGELKADPRHITDLRLN